MIQTINNCQVEYDTHRGVLYVHAPMGQTVIRICGLEINKPFNDPNFIGDITTNNSVYGLLDITLKMGLKVIRYPE